MMDYEPITKGLRDEMAHGSAGNADVVVLEKTDFEAFCDSIDAIHASLERENERLRDASERGDDWIKLPVDADGVAWNIGDRDENGYKVTSLKLTKCGWFYFANGLPNAAGEHRHHRPDTWESIISDAMRAGRADVAVDVMPLIKRCKALAGDAE